MLCLSSYVVLKNIKNSKEVRCFSFQYGNAGPRYYFSKSDIERIARQEKNMIPKRLEEKKIKDIEKRIKRLEEEEQFLAGFGHKNNKEC